MQFVIFHGAYGNPEGNWFPELKERLEDLGQEVLAPQFPVDTWNNVVEQGEGYHSPIQTLDNWLKVFEKEILPKLKKDEKICFIGHSLGPVFILHCVERFHIQLDCAIFVSPFLGPLEQWEFNAVNDTFYKTDFDFNELKELIPLSYVLYSDNDPYVPETQPNLFAQKLGSSIIPVRRAGHLNSEVNLNELPLVLELCKTRLDLSLYQRYIAHRKELYSVDYIKGKSEEIIYLKPDEVIEEGIFKFRNLRTEGFCTLYTSANFWDPNSKYMDEARKAANRIKNLTRVVLIETKEDLQNPTVQEQIKLDLKAGVKVYICYINQIKNDVDELDFGIWDNEYVCLVGFNNEQKAEEVRLSSLKVDLEKANTWKEKILENAEKINNLEQLREL